MNPHDMFDCVCHVAVLKTLQKLRWQAAFENFAPHGSRKYLQSISSFKHSNPETENYQENVVTHKIHVQVNQESHTNKIGNRQDIYISIRASSFWQSSPRNCCLLIFAYPILPVTCPDIGCLSKSTNNTKIRTKFGNIGN